jgi:hypothetical protein
MYRSRDSHQPATDREERERERERKMCRSVIAGCGLRMRRVGTGYVK